MQIEALKRRQTVIFPDQRHFKPGHTTAALAIPDVTRITKSKACIKCLYVRGALIAGIYVALYN